MMQFLRTETLDWINPKNFNLDKCSNDSSIDCVLMLVILMNCMIFILINEKCCQISIENHRRYQFFFF